MCTRTGSTVRLLPRPGCMLAHGGIIRRSPGESCLGLASPSLQIGIIRSKADVCPLQVLRWLTSVTLGCFPALYVDSFHSLSVSWSQGWSPDKLTPHPHTILHPHPHLPPHPATYPPVHTTPCKQTEDTRQKTTTGCAGLVLRSLLALLANLSSFEASQWGVDSPRVVIITGQAGSN